MYLCFAETLLVQACSLFLFLSDSFGLRESFEEFTCELRM